MHILALSIRVKYRIIITITIYAYLYTYMHAALIFCENVNNYVIEKILYS